MTRRRTGWNLARLRAAAATLLLVPVFWSHSARAGDVYNGRTVYQSYCQGCHGSSGTGEVGNAPDFTTGEGLLQSDLGLLESVAAGKGVMPGYRGVLTDEEMLDVISYLRTLF